jgi:hypothetical protein
MPEVNIILAALLAINLIAVAVWDAYVVFFGTENDTVSMAVWLVVQRVPPLAIGIGFILGHIFWPIHPSARQ